MVLTQVQQGKDYIIHALNGEAEIRLHLEGLGFIPGTRLSVVSKIGENLIVNVKGSKIALDAALAKCVLV